MGGKRQARVSYADARINQAEWEQQAVSLDVLRELTALYIESLATQANMGLAEESQRLSRSLLKPSKRAPNRVLHRKQRSCVLKLQLRARKFALLRWWSNSRVKRYSLRDSGVIRLRRLPRWRGACLNSGEIRVLTNFMLG